VSHVNANIHEGMTAHQNLHWVLSSTGLTCGHNQLKQWCEWNC